MVFKLDGRRSQSKTTVIMNEFPPVEAQGVGPCPCFGGSQHGAHSLTYFLRDHPDITPLFEQRVAATLQDAMVDIERTDQTEPH